jgi:hypothetical protein
MDDLDEVINTLETEIRGTEPGQVGDKMLHMFMLHNDKRSDELRTEIQYEITKDKAEGNKLLNTTEEELNSQQQSLLRLVFELKWRIELAIPDQGK